jgi:hypothetical protein
LLALCPDVLGGLTSAGKWLLCAFNQPIMKAQLLKLPDRFLRFCNRFSLRSVNELGLLFLQDANLF